MMDFRELNRLNRRDMLRGTAMNLARTETRYSHLV